MSSYSARDITLFSLVEALGNEVKLVLLSGEKNIGGDTLKEIKRNDGTIVAQSPDTCLESELVEYAIKNNYADKILSPREIFEGIKLI
jgi:chemotaxis response regulator CheB